MFCFCSLDSGMVRRKFGGSYKYINIGSAYFDIVAHQKFKIHRSIVGVSEHVYVNGLGYNSVLLYCRFATDIFESSRGSLDIDTSILWYQYFFVRRDQFGKSCSNRISLGMRFINLVLFIFPLGVTATTRNEKP